MSVGVVLWEKLNQKKYLEFFSATFYFEHKFDLSLS